MHIAFLTPEYPDELTKGSGGLGTSIQNMVKALVNKGVKSTVFVYGQDIDRVLLENDLTIHLIKQKPYKFLSWLRYRKYLQHYVNDQISINKIDIVEAPDWTGITAFMKFNCPLVIRFNGSDGYFCDLEKRKQKFKNWFFERIALKNAGHLVSVSKFTAKITSEVYNLNKEITIIPNSVDIEKFRPIKFENKSKQVLYFGTIIRKKGVLELAEVFNRVIKEEPEASFYFIGKDVKDFTENRSTLAIFKDKLINEARAGFHYLPEVEYSEIKDHILKSEVVVLPSFAEALPMTWIETMAMEKPLVTSNIGWAKEVMIDGETGFSVDPFNHELFAEKVLWFMQNPEKAAKIGKEARKHVRNKFSSSVVAEKNINFYRTVLRNE